LAGVSSHGSFNRAILDQAAVTQLPATVYTVSVHWSVTVVRP